MKNITDKQKARNTFWINLAERYIRFAIPTPNATKEELRERSKIIYAIAGFIVFIILAILFIINRIHQNILVSESIKIHSQITCREDHGQIIVICLPKATWDGINKETKIAWIEGEAYIVRGHQRLIISDENRRVLQDVSLR